MINKLALFLVLLILVSANFSQKTLYTTEKKSVQKSDGEENEKEKEITIEEYSSCSADCPREDNEDAFADAAKEFTNFLKNNQDCQVYTEEIEQMDGEEAFPANDYNKCIQAWNSQKSENVDEFNQYVACTCNCGGAECFGKGLGFFLIGFLGLLMVIM